MWRVHTYGYVRLKNCLRRNLMYFVQIHQYVRIIPRSLNAAQPGQTYRRAGDMYRGEMVPNVVPVSHLTHQLKSGH